MLTLALLALAVLVLAVLAMAGLGSGMGGSRRPCPLALSRAWSGRLPGAGAPHALAELSWRLRVRRILARPVLAGRVLTLAVTLPVLARTSRAVMAGLALPRLTLAGLTLAGLALAGLALAGLALAGLALPRLTLAGLARLA